MSSKQTNIAVLIFSGYNMRGIVAFCRFCKYESIKFSIIASGINDLILLSDYSQEVIAVRKDLSLTSQHILDYGALLKTLKKVTKIVLLPSSEYLIRIALDCRSTLEKEGIIVPLCENEIYRALSDKYEFQKICKKKSICVPEELKSPGRENIPFVAKPKHYFSKGRKIVSPIIITSEEDYIQLKKRPDLSDFYFQKFVGGRSIYLLYYFSKDTEFAVYAQENLIQQTDGKSIIAAKSILLPENEVVSQYAKLLQSIFFNGLIMIEIKLYEGKYYMIEANPRLWGPSQLLLDSGMDLFYLFAHDLGLITAIPKLQYKEGVKYFWSGGMFEDQFNGKTPVFHNYASNMFFTEYAEWCKADVYTKGDTFQIYQRELNR